MTKPKFDEALALVVEAACSVLGFEAVISGKVSFLRDASGIITLIDRDGIENGEKAQLTDILNKFESYIDVTFPIATPEEIYEPSLIDDSSYIRLNVVIPSGESVSVNIVDRRFVGADWLRDAQSPKKDSVPIFVFGSLKGGVGRSTALTIAAHSLSMQGFSVLAVDLDLEAPGLGSFLLPPQNRPRFGTLDFYVEHGPSRFIGADFSQLMEASPVLTGGVPVYVAPAFGQQSLANPENVLGKLSRAYVEDTTSDGNVLGFLDRTRILIEGLTAIRDFDVVLVDARAGLHETLAASILGLGAEILLFGTYQSQTFEGYRPLLSHIGTMTRNSGDLLPRIRMVHGRADIVDEKEIQNFRNESHLMFRQTLYGMPEQSPEEFESDNVTWFSVDDFDGPHFPWVVADTRTHRLFDPLITPAQLDPNVYNEAFGEIANNIRSMIVARQGTADATF